jgi:hypothetical protein
VCNKEEQKKRREGEDIRRTEMYEPRVRDEREEMRQSRKENELKWEGREREGRVYGCCVGWWIFC